MAYYFKRNEEDHCIFLICICIYLCRYLTNMYGYMYMYITNICMYIYTYTCYIAYCFIIF